MAAMETLESPAILDVPTLTEVSDDELVLEDEDQAVAGSGAGAEDLVLDQDLGQTSDPPAGDNEAGGKPDQQINGVLVLALLDRIIGAVDQIQQTQGGLEVRQQDMERSVSSIQGELTKLARNHGNTANGVTRMMEKVQKVSVNVKTVRAALEKQGGQIRRLETNEAELLKRRNFKVMVYQDEVKLPSKLSISKSMKVSDSVSGSRGGSLLELKEAAEDGEDGDKPDRPHVDLSSDEEGLDIEDAIEETRAEKIKRSSLQRVQTLKTVFSREKMDKTRAKTKENLEKTKQKTKDNLEKTKQKTKENLEKTKQKTKENLEKTRQKTKENLEKTRHNIEKKMGKLGTRMSVNPDRKQKMKTSGDKVKKAFTPDHVVYARSKTAVYKVPPFTFHVKKIRDGAAEETVMGTEMVEVEKEGEVLQGDDLEVEVEMEMMNGGGEDEELEEEEEEEEEHYSHDALEEEEEKERESD